MRSSISGRVAPWLSALAAAALLLGCGGGDDAPPAAAPAPATPQAITTTSLNLGTPNATAATLRTPTSGDAHVGIVVMHPYSSYVNFNGCTKLAERGFAVVCVDSSFTGKQFEYYGYEQHVPAIKAAVAYLRAQPKITKVLLFGHSMGAPMMTFYQNVTENGTSVCTGPEKLSPCVTTNLASLPFADGLILFDSHLGESLATYTYVDRPWSTTRSAPATRA